MLYQKTISMFSVSLTGNYFIMDSEQLVSNPFAELQQEAVQQAEQNQGKRNSMTEKLTSVKNNVCEKHFVMARSRLEREKTSRLKQLHDHANRLRHQVGWTHPPSSADHSSTILLNIQQCSFRNMTLSNQNFDTLPKSNRLYN